MKLVVYNLTRFYIGNHVQEIPFRTGDLLKTAKTYYNKNYVCNQCD